MGNNSDPTVRPPGEAADQLKELLAQGESAARAGRPAEARHLFRQALSLDPSNELAWLWLAFLAPTPRQSLAYLQQARAYHPHSSRVRQALAWAQGQFSEAEVAPAPRPAPERRAAAAAATRSMARPQAPARRRSALRWPLLAVALSGLGLVAALVAFGLPGRTADPPGQPSPTSFLLHTPTGDMAALRDLASQAISQEAWEQAIPILDNMHRLSPDDEGVRQQLAVAHLRFGLQLVEMNHLDEAIAHYDAAIRFYANDMDLQTARRLAIGYRDGRRALGGQRWGEAAALLEPVFQVAPGFRDVADLLFAAYLQAAREREEAQQLEAARDAYAKAVAVRPDSEEAQARLAQITRILTPPTPTPTPAPRKRIEVNVSQQRLRAYENEELVFDWLCSTGIPSHPTQYGNFQILDKIPEAWSSAWGLRMPYWMGIYWAGASENGIHALPILRNGVTVWAGYLGQRISYGCIVLDTPNAATLYEWAEIGTPVTIVP